MPRGRGVRRPGRSLAIATLLLAAAACAPSAREPAPRSLVVDIRGLAFVPSELEANVGDTIVWVNHDIMPHTATATGDITFETGSIDRDMESRAIVMDAAGTVQYICRLHPSMRGSITVR